MAPFLTIIIQIVVKERKEGRWLLGLPSQIFKCSVSDLIHCMIKGVTELEKG